MPPRLSVLQNTFYVRMKMAVQYPTPQWILNHKRSWNSLPKCELYWENATRPRPLPAYHTHLDISSRSVRYALSVSSDLTLTYNANSLSSSVSTTRNQVPKSASCPTAPTAALDDHSNDSNGEDDNDYEQVHKCVSRPKIQSNTSKPPSATSSTATKTIQTQFPISKKTSKLETGLLKLLAVKVEPFVKELSQKAKRKAQVWPGPKTTKSASTTNRFTLAALVCRHYKLPINKTALQNPQKSLHGTHDNLQWWRMPLKE